MKIASVKLSLKKGIDKMSRYYRPISILPVFSKILEKLMYNRLIPFVKKHSILSEAQNEINRNS